MLLHCCGYTYESVGNTVLTTPKKNYKPAARPKTTICYQGLVYHTKQIVVVSNLARQAVSIMQKAVINFKICSRIANTWAAIVRLWLCAKKAALPKMRKPTPGSWLSHYISILANAILLYPIS
jgi:hypothetical protein